jgi:hypothetical protein
VEQVELLIMKGLSQGLVKGRIDEVGTATFTLLSIVTFAALHPGLRIRIHFIRIRIQHFRLNTNPDPDPGL